MARRQVKAIEHRSEVRLHGALAYRESVRNLAIGFSVDWEHGHFKYSRGKAIGAGTVARGDDSSEVNMCGLFAMGQPLFADEPTITRAFNTGRGVD